MRLIITVFVVSAVFAPSPRAQSSSARDAITRVALMETRSMHVERVTYAPGAVEPPGNHGYDIVIVPGDHDGMSVELEGEPVEWTRGRPILISRGAPHRLKNVTNHIIPYLEVRTLDDSPAGTDEVVRSSGVTIARSIVGKYLRATVLRMDANGSVEWPFEKIDAVELIVPPLSPATGGPPLWTETPVPAEYVRYFMRAAGGGAFRSLTSHVEPELEVIRVSRMVVSR